jgi:hypothetical protein
VAQSLLFLSFVIATFLPAIILKFKSNWFRQQSLKLHK